MHARVETPADRLLEREMMGKSPSWVGGGPGAERELLGNGVGRDPSFQGGEVGRQE